MESLPEESQLTLQDAELQVTEFLSQLWCQIGVDGLAGKEQLDILPPCLPLSFQGWNLLFRNLLDVFSFITLFHSLSLQKMKNKYHVRVEILTLLQG